MNRKAKIQVTCWEGYPLVSCCSIYELSTALTIYTRLHKVKRFRIHSTKCVGLQGPTLNEELLAVDDC